MQQSSWRVDHNLQPNSTLNEVDERSHFPMVEPIRHNIAGMPLSYPDADAAFVEMHHHAWFYMHHHAWLYRIIRRMAETIEIERAHRVGFLFTPVWAGSGALIYFNLSYEMHWSDAFIILLIVTGFRFLCRHYYLLKTISGFSLCLCAGLLAAKLETWRLDTVMLGNNVSTNLTGRLVDLEKRDGGRYRLLIDILATDTPSLKYAPSRVQLTARLSPQGIKVGDIIEGRVHMRPPSGPVRTDGYDFAFNLYFKGIGAQGYFVGMPQKSKLTFPVSLKERLFIGITRLRSLMTARIQQVIKGENGAIAAALITGQRGGISTATNDAMRLSGLSHILSISGLHMAMVTGLFLWGMQSIFAFFPVFSSHYPVKKVAAGAALFMSAFYLMLSGADVAAQRSFIMVAVMLFAIVLDRAALTMRNLAIAAWITLILTPHEILGPSFQMSFAATAGLIAAFGWWSRYRQNAGNLVEEYSFVMRIVRSCFVAFLSTAAASLIAGTVSGLYSAYQFNNIALLGVLSNALAFPVMSVIVMPFALIAVLLMPLGLEYLPLCIMGYGIDLVRDIALWTASLSPNFNFGRITTSAILAMSAGLVCLLFMHSILRFFGLAGLIVGIIINLAQPKPQILVSEDARLVAFFDPQGHMAVNQKNTSSFVVDNWRRTFAIPDIIHLFQSQKHGGMGFYASVVIVLLFFRMDDVCIV